MCVHVPQCRRSEHHFQESLLTFYSVVTGSFSLSLLLCCILSAGWSAGSLVFITRFAVSRMGFQMQTTAPGIARGF